MGIHVRIFWRKSVAVMSSFMLIPALALPVVQEQSGTAAEEQAPKISNEQLDSLVAPIALYPDPLLAQVLVASTYPLELVQLKQWLDKNKDLKDKALSDAVAKQSWDASVQAMAALPDAVKRLTDDIGWTTDLGNAFLAQQSDVMDAVQRMRAKAKDSGNLKSNEQMKVETKVVESKSVVVIEQSKPEVVYVPSYNPTVVYGPPVYPYPPITYPPPGYYAAGAAISFGVGMAIGAAWGGGGWGYNSGWGGHNDITINNNNSFVNNSNRQNVSGNGNRAGNGNGNGNRTGNTWQHNPQHRGGAPYGNKTTANKFGGTARGDSMSSRQANARQNQSQAGGRGQQARTADRGDARQSAGASNRGSGNAGGGTRGTTGNRGSGDRVGDRSVSSGSGGSKGGGGFGGGSGSMSGSSARASSSRGSSSAGGGGGRSRGGGGRRR
jgi:hypothetical protein